MLVVTKLPTMKILSVFVSYILTFIHGTSSELQIDPKDPFVTPGENLSVLCQSDHPLAICRIKVGGFKNALVFLDSSNNTSSREYAYYGTGLKNGQCGITLFNVNDMANGVLECSVYMLNADTNEESSAKTNITVIRSPKNPELSIQNLNSTKSNVFYESHVLRASCSVQEGRPLANMTWYLGGNIITNRIQSQVSVDTSDRRTITQTMVKTLSWRDNNRQLICAARHSAWPSVVETSIKLNVVYVPRCVLLTKAIEVYGLKLNEMQNITVEIFSNPKPLFTWLIPTKTELFPLNEGQHSTDKNLFAWWSEKLGEDKWQVVLQFKNFTKADVGKRYHLWANNTIGRKRYEVLLSTDDESALKLGVNSYILIVGVSTCLFVFGVILTVTITQRRKKKKFLIKAASNPSEKITKLDVES